MSSNNDAQNSSPASSSISKVAQQTTQQAGDMLRTVGDKAEALKGQNESIDKAVDYVQEYVLGTKTETTRSKDAVPKDKTIDATDEQIEDLLRDQNRSVR